MNPEQQAALAALNREQQARKLYTCTTMKQVNARVKQDAKKKATAPRMILSDAETSRILSTP